MNMAIGSQVKRFPRHTLNLDRSVPFFGIKKIRYGLWELETALGTFRIRGCRIRTCTTKFLPNPDVMRVDFGPQRKGEKWPTSAIIVGPGRLSLPKL